jgi:hypothetical protein
LNLTRDFRELNEVFGRSPATGRERRGDQQAAGT